MGFYNEIYNLIVQYVFAGAELGSFEQLAVTELSLTLSLVAISVPVIVILWALKKVVF